MAVRREQQLQVILNFGEHADAGVVAVQATLEFGARGGQFDGRERSGLNHTLVLRVLRASEINGLGSHLHIFPRGDQAPVGLLDAAHHVDGAHFEIGFADVERLPSQPDLRAIAIDLAIAKQRLREARDQSRSDIWIQRSERVRGGCPAVIEVEPELRSLPRQLLLEIEVLREVVLGECAVRTLQDG